MLTAFSMKYGSRMTSVRATIYLPFEILNNFSWAAQMPMFSPLRVNLYSGNSVVTISTVSSLELLSKTLISIFPYVWLLTEFKVWRINLAPVRTAGLIVTGGLWYIIFFFNYTCRYCKH